MDHRGNEIYIYFWCLTRRRMMIIWGAVYSQFLFSEFFFSLFPFLPNLGLLFWGWLLQTTSSGSSVFGCWMWAEAWKRKRGGIIILCIPPQLLEPQGWWCSFVAAAIFFPALVSSGLGVVMDFHCCWVLGASASFVCSLNPAHASILSVLVHVCLVKFLPMYHLLPARSWLIQHDE